MRTSKLNQSDTMKSMLLAAAVLLLAGCTITKEPQVSEVIQTTGVVRLNFNEAMLQNARFDEYTTHGTATRQCQQMGYATAAAYGQPIRTCSVFSGSLCLNDKITLQYQCQGLALSPAATGYY